ncbi:HAD family hydrolase [Brachybacterium squillarum]|uniref:HAD family hydrolase n=1 Tax=Brachybacterium squillarum TaxID=661979 RepID=UPI002222F31B|nr:HAD family hydrolase [Brachybacterium squillarum]MCW1806593.1 Cof-type HAD-IIB family hydrolase [Brachybacterium squillarum]
MRLPEGRRIVFLDIDGTIIAHDGTIPDSAAAAIREARAAGHLVLLATGRSPREVDPRLEEIGFDGAVLSAGAFVRIDDAWIIEHPMPAPMVRRMVEGFDALGLDYALQARDGVHPSAGRREDVREVLGIGEAQLGEAAEGAAHAHVAKAVFLGREPDAFARVHALLAPEGFTVITGTMPSLGTGGGEVSPGDVSKGASILELLEREGIDPSRAIGIGDNNNDLEMLAACGVGIAMGNATAEALAAADEITGAVHEDGLAEAFARHGLIARPRARRDPAAP